MAGIAGSTCAGEAVPARRLIALVSSVLRYGAEMIAAQSLSAPTGPDVSGAARRSWRWGDTSQENQEGEASVTIIACDVQSFRIKKINQLMVSEARKGEKEGMEEEEGRKEEPE